MNFRGPFLRLRSHPSGSKCGLKLCAYFNWQEKVETLWDHLKTLCVYSAYDGQALTHSICTLTKDKPGLLAQAQHCANAVTHFSAWSVVPLYLTYIHFKNKHKEELFLYKCNGSLHICWSEVIDRLQT